MQTVLRLKSKLTIITVMLCLFVTSVQSLSFEYSTDKNGRVTIGPERVDINSLPPNQKESALRSIRLDLDNPDFTHVGAAMALLGLHDSEGMAHLAAVYRSSSDPRAFDDIINYGDAAMIPYLIQDLSADSSVKVSIGTYVPPGSLRSYSRILLFKCIQNTKNFPPVTKNWIRDYYGLDSDSQREEIKEWWQHNKEAITTAQYEKATWVPKPGWLNRWFFNRLYFDSHFVFAGVAILLFVVVSWLLICFGRVFKRQKKI